MRSDPGPQTPPRLCRYPGCTRPARLAEGRGAPPRYCDLPGHHRRSANKQRARLRALAPPEPDLDTDPRALLDYISELREQIAVTRDELATERARRHDPPDNAAAEDAGQSESEVSWGG